MLRILVITLLALAVVVATAAAQTGTPSQTTTTTQSTTPTSNPNQGAYDKLSPGNQKIAQALYDAQKTNTPMSGSTSGTPSTSTAPKTLTRDDIAAMKQHRGWGEIFKDLKAKGYYSDYKNLGQVVSRSHHQAKSPSGTTITTGSGRSEVVGKSGKGHIDDNASAGTGGGQGSNSGSSASAGRGGNSGHGGVQGK